MLFIGSAPELLHPSLYAAKKKMTFFAKDMIPNVEEEDITGPAYWCPSYGVEWQIDPLTGRNALRPNFGTEGDVPVYAKDYQ